MSLTICTNGPIGLTFATADDIVMAHSKWRQLPNICLVWAHDGHVRILPNILYWPMMAACIFCLRARISPIQLIMYLTIYTFGPIGRNLCNCRLACNGPQQVTTAAEHMSHVGL